MAEATRGWKKNGFALANIARTYRDNPKTTVGLGSIALAVLFGGGAAAASFFAPGLRNLHAGAKAGIIVGSSVAGAALPILGYGGYKGGKWIRETIGDQLRSEDLDDPSSTPNPYGGFQSNNLFIGADNLETFTTV